MRFATLLVCVGCPIGMVVGLMHIGFALTDPAPRNIWDWYVVAMGIGMFAMMFPAARYLAQQAVKRI